MDLTENNTDAFRRAVKDLYDKFYEMSGQAQAQQAAISGIIERMHELERMIVIQRARITGTGPTVK